MIINAWPDAFKSKYGEKFPTDYMTIDAEYTGTGSQDVVLEIGHTVVVNNEVIDKLNVILNWYDYPGISKEWLDYKSQHMRSIMGEAWNLSPEKIRTGIAPQKALKFYYTLLTAYKANGMMFVGQNSLRADFPVLAINTKRVLGKEFTLDPNRYIDTGAIFKANTVYTSSNRALQIYREAILPQENDTLIEYFSRIIGMRIANVPWSLSKMLEHYSLFEKHNVSAVDQHSAGFDSMCLHWIMQEFHKELCSAPASFGIHKEAASVGPTESTNKKPTSRRRKRKAKRMQRKV